MISSLPPPSGSLRFYVARAAFYARALAVVLAVVVSARFAVAALSHALDVSTGASDKPAPRPIATAPLPEPSTLSPARQAALAPPPVTPIADQGRAVAVTLGIDYGTPRSDVYVNGRRVGNTPFLGDTSCKTGQKLKIEIVPAKGPPFTYERECRGGSIEIHTEPP